METRKLIGSGPSSLVISLPSKWIKDNSLGKGLPVDIEYFNNDLLIKAKKTTNDQKQVKEYTIKHDEPYLIKEELVYCFLHNIDKVLVPVKQINRIKSVLNKIPGAELRIEKEQTYIHICLDKNNVKPEFEIKYCLKLARETLQRIATISNEDDSFEINNLLGNMKRRLVIAESVVNKWITNPEERIKTDLNLSEITRLKMFLSELPRLLGHQVRLSRKMVYSENKSLPVLFAETDKFFKTELEEKDIKLLTKEKTAIRNKIEDLTQALINIKNKKELMIIDQMITILHSLERLTYIRRPFVH